jgi:hypothetical protein
MCQVMQAIFKGDCQWRNTSRIPHITREGVLDG